MLAEWARRAADGSDSDEEGRHGGGHNGGGGVWKGRGNRRKSVEMRAGELVPPVGVLHYSAGKVCDSDCVCVYWCIGGWMNGVERKRGDTKSPPILTSIPLPLQHNTPTTTTTTTTITGAVRARHRRPALHRLPRLRRRRLFLLLPPPLLPPAGGGAGVRGRRRRGIRRAGCAQQPPLGHPVGGVAAAAAGE